MSHAACVPQEHEDGSAARAALASTPETDAELVEDDFGQSYDCVNDCMASLGIPDAVAGTVVDQSAA
jgi:hypothetical protein